MESVPPEFPTLIVYEDSSIGAYTAIEDWTNDVDQWYWSDPEDYLIDCRGRKYIQKAQRGHDERPTEIPSWEFDSNVDENLIDSLVSTELGSSDWTARDELADSNERIRYMIEQVLRFHPK